MWPNRIAKVLLVIAVVILARKFLLQEPPEATTDRLPTETVRLVAADGSEIKSLKVERAETPQAQARGLMWRRYLSEDSGMLFVYSPPQPVVMWMKNTSLPLDMLFVNEHGVIVQIVENPEPMSEAPLPSEQPVQAVLEVNHGLVAERGIRVGDRLYYRQS